VRIGPDTYPLRPGDVVASPPGGPEVAHQIINTGTELGPGPEGKPQIFRFLGDESQSVDYWDGE
jgi:hypothetical protein